MSLPHHPSSVTLQASSQPYGNAPAARSGTLVPTSSYAEMQDADKKDDGTSIRAVDAGVGAGAGDGQGTRDDMDAGDTSGSDSTNPAKQPVVGHQGHGHGLRRLSTNKVDQTQQEKPGPPPGRPRKFSHGFFDKELTPLRKAVFKVLGGSMVITILLMWICLPFYWGASWKANHYTDKLTVRVIDRDGGAIGQEVSQFLLSQKTLHYFYTSPDELPTDAAVNHDIIQEGAWATVEIAAGATERLAAARASGDSSYRGTSAITLTYAQARQETAIGSYLLPLAEGHLSAVSAKISAESIARYLSAQGGNATAMGLLARAPGTVASGVSFSLNNIRPYNQPVASAITLVGFIYMLIFSFFVTMVNAACRQIIGDFLTYKAYVAYRILLPVTLYLPLSLVFAMVNLPFKVHFGAHFTYAGGFFLWWIILFLGMTCMGYATEFAVTILTVRFAGFFLIPLIIANVSVVSLPHELQPWIYRYGVAMPFYNASRAVRCIIFDTKNDLGKNCGILLGWVVFSAITIAAITWVYRRKDLRAAAREEAAKEGAVERQV